MYPSPPHTHSLSNYQNPLPDGTTVTADEPTLTHHNHRNSIASIKDQSCCNMFCEFGQMWKWQSTPVFLPGDSHGQRSLVGCSPWVHKESDTTK